MNKAIKIIIKNIIFVIIFLLLLTGCGAMGPAGNKGDAIFNGISYTYYKDFEYENETYSIYHILEGNMQLLNGNIIYIYDEYNIKEYDSNITLWTINYLKDNKYYIYNSQNNISKTHTSSDFMNEIKHLVEDLLKRYEQKLNITFEIYNDEEKIEQEFTINNTTNYNKIYILDMYIPFVINNLYTYETYTILIPVKTIIGYENQGEMSFVYEKDKIVSIDYKNFAYKNSITEREK